MGNFYTWQKVNIFGLPTHLSFSTYFLNDPLFQVPTILQIQSILKHKSYAVWQEKGMVAMSFIMEKPVL